ncbi:L,D-transpeptidase scaffold domain-containing protein, partial [Streptomyces europaeiscabiei]|uniref:hypothetical protein n=1 Tax=Streptomyces europaeiscabiei TaxID=146819 RepID=UPI0038F6B1A9
HDLHGDSTDLAIKYPGWSLKRNGLDLPSLLAGAIEKGNLNEFITSLVPKHNEYLKLATALKTYRSYLSKGEWQIIDAGPALLPKERGP